MRILEMRTQQSAILLMLLLCCITGCLRHPGRWQNDEIQTPQTDLFSGLDLEWGRDQMVSMLLERRSMAVYLMTEGITKPVLEEDTVYQYALHRFAGLNLPTRVAWGGDPPLGTEAFLAMHKAPENGHNGIVYICESYPSGVKHGQPLAFEELWFHLIFEFFNMENTQSFLDLEEQATLQLINRNQWTTNATRLEHSALLRTVDFYHTVWLSWTYQNCFESDPLIWRTNTPASFDEFIALYDDVNGYPWNYWGKIYDERIAPSFPYFFAD